MLNMAVVKLALIKHISYKRLFNFLIDSCNTRQYLSFKIFQHSAAAGRYITHFISKAKLVNCCNAIATTYQGEMRLLQWLLQQLRQCFCTMLEFFHFKNTHRAIP